MDRPGRGGGGERKGAKERVFLGREVWINSVSLPRDRYPLGLSPMYDGASRGLKECDFPVCKEA